MSKNVKSNDDKENLDKGEKKIAKKEQLDFEKLESIGEEIKKNKKKISKETNLKRTNIISNLFIAMFIVVYFSMLLKATVNIPTIELLTDFKVFIIFELVCTLILLEFSIRKDSSTFFAFGIEMMLLGIATLAYMNLYNIAYSKINLFTVFCIGFFTIYYLIKALIIGKRN